MATTIEKMTPATSTAQAGDAPDPTSGEPRPARPNPDAAQAHSAERRRNVSPNALIGGGVAVFVAIIGIIGALLVGQLMAINDSLGRLDTKIDDSLGRLDTKIDDRRGHQPARHQDRRGHQPARHQDRRGHQPARHQDRRARDEPAHRDASRVRSDQRRAARPHRKARTPRSPCRARTRGARKLTPLRAAHPAAVGVSVPMAGMPMSW